MLKSAYRLWVAAFAPVRVIVSTLLLAAIYYALLVPVALVWRRTRAAPRDRRFDAQLDSYWIDRPPADAPERYFRRY